MCLCMEARKRALGNELMLSFELLLDDTSLQALKEDWGLGPALLPYPVDTS